MSLLLSGAGYLSVFSADQLHALGTLFFNLHEYGYCIALISWGLYLLPLGYLVFKSDFLPRDLGVLVTLAGLFDFVQLIQVFLFPNYQVITCPGLAVAMMAEFGLALWFLTIGAKDQKPALVEAG